MQQNHFGQKVDPYDWQQKEYERKSKAYFSPRKQYNLLEHAQVIDGYLSELTRYLGNDVSAEEKSEIHAELRRHIEMMAAAEEELGASEVEAIRRAIERFGDAKKLGKQLARESRSSKINSHFFMANWTVGMAFLHVFLVYWAVMHLTHGAYFLISLAAISVVALLTGEETEQRRPGRGVDASLIIGGAEVCGFSVLWGLGEFFHLAVPLNVSIAVSKYLHFFTGEDVLIACLFFMLSAFAAYVTGVRRVGYWYRYPITRLKRLPVVYGQWWVRLWGVDSFSLLDSASRIRGKESGVAELARLE